MTTTTEARDDLRSAALAAGERFAAREGEAGHEELTREILAWAAETFGEGLIVASNMQDAVLVELGAAARPGVDVLFLETGYHFAETLGTRDAVAQTYGVTIVQAEPELTVAEQDATFGKDLFNVDPGACCTMRKVEPLKKTLARYDAWVTGVRRVEAPDPRGDAPGHLGRAPRPRQDQPDRPLDRRADGRLHPRARGAREPAGRGGLPLDRLRALHRQAGPGRRPAQRALGGLLQDRVRAARMTAAAVETAQLDQLDALESEAIHIMREVAGEFDRPVILFSGGKDSMLLVHLARKAFWPAPIPFPVLHVDTGHNFDEVIDFRDAVVERYGLSSRSRASRTTSTTGGSRSAPTARATRCRPRRCSTPSPSTATTRCSAADDATRSGRAPRSACSACATPSASGSRRGSGPSCGTSTTGATSRLSTCACSRCRTSPSSTSGATSQREGIELPSIYYAHTREVFSRDGMWLTSGPWFGPRDDEEVVAKTVRYRTVGDGSCTGAVESDASTLDEVLDEVRESRLTERGATRADDRLSEAAMEDRKREGYF